MRTSFACGLIHCFLLCEVFIGGTKLAEKGGGGNRILTQDQPGAKYDAAPDKRSWQAMCDLFAEIFRAG